MKDASTQDEKVPYEMAEGKSFPRVKQDPHHVASPAESKPDESGCRQVFKQGFDSDHGDPAHHQVEYGRYDIKPAGKKCLEYDAGDRDAPHYTENCPSPAAADGHQAEWRI